MGKESRTLFVNPRAAADLDPALEARFVLTTARAAAAWRRVTAWPGYSASPLIDLPGLAATAGWRSLRYKDEGGRFGLGSFKALGGAYAVGELLRRKAAGRDGDDADLAARVTVCCATDGNHGRSVAWGARVFGCRAVIYLPAAVSPGREAAIAQYGAETLRCSGNYDEVVRRAALDAAENGWTVVSDTSYPGYEEIPADVMSGYTVMAEEVVRQTADEAPPTHVFLQGGVGGLAAAVALHLWRAWPEARPRFAVVEPENAACLFESARAGRRVAIEGDLDTVMAGLSCGEASLIAWPILDAALDAFLTVPDAAALDLMRRLADPVAGDPPIVAGESAVAGLAGALAPMGDPAKAEALGLGPDSRVLVFGTEGDTDPEVYRSIVGRTAAEVRAP